MQSPCADVKISHMNEGKTTYPPQISSLLAFVVPPAFGVFIANLVTFTGAFENSILITLGAVGIISYFMGRRWYVSEELGFRGGRPFMAGAGFALLGWIGLLIARAVSVAFGPPSETLAVTFLYLLIFEAFCVQLWTFGLLFRSLTMWRHPINAAILSGVVFGITAFIMFGEVPLVQRDLFPLSSSVLYFIVWGIFYGIIRLRTGSIFGTVITQAVQTLTVWHLITPIFPENISTSSSLLYLYGIAGAIFLLATWRLFPKLVSDYRI